MSNISIGFCDFWPGFDVSHNVFIDILSKNFDVTINHKNPDFLFCSIFGNKSFKHHCTKILFMGENATPDFNIFDYALGFDWISFEDRYFRLPLYRLYMDRSDRTNHDKDFFAAEAAAKVGFCNFLYSNNRCAHPLREHFFDLLSMYKKVDSGGKVRNNIGYFVDDKLAWQRNYKFSIAFENSLKLGYSTEKLYDAFRAHTVPIYWGNPIVGREFNSRRFINVHDYASLGEVIDRVRELDNDPQQFLEVLSEPCFDGDIPPELPEDAALKNFLTSIVAQGSENSRRVTRDGYSRDYYSRSRITAALQPSVAFLNRSKNFLLRSVAKLRDATHLG